MWNPDEDEVEDGDFLFDDGQDAFDRWEAAQEDKEYWMNRPDSSGFAPADFIYDPVKQYSREK